MVTIKDITPESPAEDMGLQAGDRIVTINDHEIYDILGLRFWSSDSKLDIAFNRNGKPVNLRCDKDPDEDLGVTISPLKVRRCANKCVFCYVDQLPGGLRAPLYVKDEDFRLSFLHGNYVTLTNLKHRDLQRIIDERLSPLYVSVHATDTKVRQRLLGLRAPDNILQTMKLLTDAGIRLHTQIVICPGWNDGDVLEQTIEDLAELVPGIRSISLVPVGLTKHRNGLTPLRQLTTKEAQDIMGVVKRWQTYFLQQIGMRIIYPSDELLLMTNSRIPGTSYYDYFPQVENGVGLIRLLINELQRDRQKLPKQLNNKKITLVTGVLAAPILHDRVVPALERVKGLNINVIAVKNRLLGDTVTVSGLLAGGDILKELENKELGDALVLPKNVLNYNDLFLDDLSLTEFRKALKTPVFVYGQNEKFPQILRKIGGKIE